MYFSKKGVASTKPTNIATIVCYTAHVVVSNSDIDLPPLPFDLKAVPASRILLF
jgi:hypothetical protein